MHTGKLQEWISIGINHEKNSHENQIMGRTEVAKGAGEE